NPQEQNVMSDNHSLMKQQTMPADDGWNDAANEAGERTIRGTLLKFSDWRWTAGKEATEIETGTRLVALATKCGSGGKAVSRPSIVSESRGAVCPSARNSVTTIKANGRKARAANLKTHGAIHGWST